MISQPANWTTPKFILRGLVSSLQQVLNSGKGLPPAITPAEREIATLVKAGMTCNEIAIIGGMSVKSVENVRAALRRKLNIDRRDNLKAILREYGEV